jgi:hypothetical protein
LKQHLGEFAQGGVAQGGDRADELVLVDLSVLGEIDEFYGFAGDLFRTPICLHEFLFGE